MAAISVVDARGARRRGDLRARRPAVARACDAPKTVMTITLGGGGEGRAKRRHDVDRRTRRCRRPSRAEKREAVRPPAAKAPEMTVPKPNARPTKATPPPTVAQAPDEARGRTPTRGEEVAAGQRRRRDRRARPGLRAVDWRRRRIGLVSRRREFLLSRLPGDDDRAHSRELESPGGRPGHRRREVHDQAGRQHHRHRRRKIERHRDARPRARSARSSCTRQLPPLPAQFPNPTLTVHLNFQFQ